MNPTTTPSKKAPAPHLEIVLLRGPSPRTTSESELDSFGAATIKAAFATRGREKRTINGLFYEGRLPMMLCAGYCVAASGNDPLSGIEYLEKHPVKPDNRLGCEIEKYTKHCRALGGTGNGAWVHNWTKQKQLNLAPEKVLTGDEAVTQFSQFLMNEWQEKAEKRKMPSEVVAITAGPLLAAFVIKLQEKIKEQIIPATPSRTNRLFPDIFGPSERIGLTWEHKDLPYLTLSYRKRAFKVYSLHLRQLAKMD